MHVPASPQNTLSPFTLWPSRQQTGSTICNILWLCRLRIAWATTVSRWNGKMPSWKISVFARWARFHHVHLWWDGRKSVSYPDFALLVLVLKSIAFPSFFFFKRTVDPLTERCWPSPKPRQMKNVCWQVSNGAKKIGVTVAPCDGVDGERSWERERAKFCVCLRPAQKHSGLSSYISTNCPGVVVLYSVGRRTGVYSTRWLWANGPVFKRLSHWRHDVSVLSRDSVCLCFISYILKFWFYHNIRCRRTRW